MPNRNTNAAQTPGQPAQIIPFVNGAHEHVELVTQFLYTPTAALQVFGPFDIPPYGYIRNLVIDIAISAAGTAGAGVLAADAPANIIQSVNLNDVNGANLVYPIDGYALMWVNIVGGWAYVADPRLSAVYSNTVAGPSILMRLPLEITSFDAFGSLANQDSSATYKLYLTLNTQGAIYSTAPTAYPTFQVTVWMEAWTVPDDEDMLGNPQEQAPPGLGSGRYISQNIQPVVAGANTIPVKRVGNLLEAMLIINRTAAGVRSDGVGLNPWTVRWDGREMWQAVSQRYLQQIMRESMEGPVTRDTGVYVLPFNKATQNKIGNGPLRQLWPTVQSSRVEFQGTAVEAGNMQIVSLDMTVQEVDPANRYVLDSATGFHPEVGTQVKGAM